MPLTDIKGKLIKLVGHRDSLIESIATKGVILDLNADFPEIIDGVDAIVIGGGSSITHTVALIDWRGNTIETLIVNHGENATPSAYSGDGQFGIFHSWIGSLNNVTEDRRIYAQYTVLDNKTRLKIFLSPTALSPTFSFYRAGAYIIDWGDGTTDSGNSSGGFSISHPYAAAGWKVITLTNLGLGTANSSGYVVISSSSQGASNPYSNTLKEIILSNDCAVQYQSLSYQNGLKNILIPYGYTNKWSNSYVCKGLYLLEHLTIPTTFTQGIFIGTSDGYPAMRSMCIGNFYLMQNLSNFLYSRGAQYAKIYDVFGWGTKISMYMFYGFSSLTEINIPSTITEIAQYAFAACSSLSAISLPPIASIPASVFVGCSCLKEITLPPSVISIGESAFLSCTALRELRIPASVNSLGANIIFNCYNLESVIFESETPPATLPSTALSSILSAQTVIYVPDAAVATYKAVANLSTLVNRIYPISQKPA